MIHFFCCSHFIFINPSEQINLFQQIPDNALFLSNDFGLCLHTYRKVPLVSVLVFQSLVFYRSLHKVVSRIVSVSGEYILLFLLLYLLARQDEKLFKQIHSHG